MNKVYSYQTGEINEEKVSSLLYFFYNTKIGRCFLKIIILKPITNLGKWYLNSRLSKIHIKRFIKKNHIDMSDYEKQEYKSFDDFFTRKIQLNKRVVSKNKSDFICPADSKLSIYSIDDNSIFNIKHSFYGVKDLLQDEKLAKKYKNGLALIFRLSVDDYHHYIYPDSGKTISTKEIPGKYHTVNPIAVGKKKVYIENHRIVTQLATDNLQDIVYVEVGALMVGRIINKNLKTFKKGEEKGYFCFGGSTIVILVQPNIITINKDILKYTDQGIEVKLKLGQTIGKIRDEL